MNHDRMERLAETLTAMPAFNHGNRHLLRQPPADGTLCRGLYDIAHADFNMADVLRVYDPRNHTPFDYRRCRTAVCIAGTALLLFAPPASPQRATARLAADALDLDDRQAHVLFTPKCFPNWYALASVTPKQAAVAVTRARRDHGRDNTFGNAIWSHVLDTRH